MSVLASDQGLRQREARGRPCHRHLAIGLAGTLIGDVFLRLSPVWYAYVAKHSVSTMCWIRSGGTLGQSYSVTRLQTALSAGGGGGRFCAFRSAAGRWKRPASHSWVRTAAMALEKLAGIAARKAPCHRDLVRQTEERHGTGAYEAPFGRQCRGPHHFLAGRLPTRQDIRRDERCSLPSRVPHTDDTLNWPPQGYRPCPVRSADARALTGKSGNSANNRLAYR